MNMPLYDALKSAGTPEPAARAAAIATPNGDDLVTKKDLEKVRVEVRGEIREVRGEIREAREETGRKIAEEINRQTWRIISAMIGIGAIFAAQMFFGG